MTFNSTTRIKDEFKRICKDNDYNQSEILDNFLKLFVEVENVKSGVKTDLDKFLRATPYWFAKSSRRRKK